MAPVLSFGIRDLLWAMVVVSLAVGWWVNREQWRQVERATYRELTAAEVEVARLRIETDNLELLLRSRLPADSIGNDFHFKTDR